MTESLTAKFRQLSELPIGYLANTTSEHTTTTQFGTVALGAPLSYYVMKPINHLFTTDILNNKLLLLLSIFLIS